MTSERPSPSAIPAALPGDPVERLVAVGKAMFGDAWQAELATAIGAGRNTVGRWAARRYPTPTGLDERLAMAARSRAAELRELADRLEIMAARLYGLESS